MPLLPVAVAVLRAMALEIHGGQAENAEKREERKIF
jgi:hypothetical protein